MRIIKKIAIFALLLLLGCGKQPQTEIKSLRLYAGAGLRRGIDAAVSEFEKDTGIKVEPDYGGSGMIISRAGEDTDADLFMPGDVWYVDILQQKSGLIESKTAVAYFVPVIIVAKGNPKKITGLKDFFKDDVKVAIGNPKACQIGRITGRIFEKSGLDLSRLDPKESLTVNELGVWVKMSDVDASIVWDAIAANIADGIEEITIPKEKNVISNVVIGLMTTSKDKISAQRFIDFLVSGKGRAILKEKGYRINEQISKSADK